MGCSGWGAAGLGQELRVWPEEKGISRASAVGSGSEQGLGEEREGLSLRIQLAWAQNPGKLKDGIRSSHCGSVVMNPTSILEDVGSIPGLTQWVKDLGVAVSCGLGL